LSVVLFVISTETSQIVLTMFGQAVMQRNYEYEHMQKQERTNEIL